MTLALARYELGRLLRAPAAWGLAAAAQLLAGLFFKAHVQAFLDTQAESRGHFSLTAQVVGPYAGLLSLVLLLLLPLATMASLAGERRAGSLGLWQASPAGPWRIVLAKYLALLAWASGLLAWLALPVLSLLLGGSLDLGQAGLTAGGLWLFAAAVLAVGLAASAWVGHAAAAAGLGYGVLLPLWLVESATLNAQGPALAVAEGLSLLGHFRRLREGLLDTADPAYYLALAALALCLAVAGLARERRSRRRVLAELAAAVLGFALLLPASQLWRLRRDLSDNGWNSLSATTRAALAALPAAPQFTLYAPEAETRSALRRVLEPYRAARPALVLREAGAGEAERDGLPAGANLRLAAGAARVDLRYPFTELPEAVLGQALARLARTGERWLVFIEGHGERDAFGRTPRDLGEFRRRLEARGLTVVAQSLGRLPALPDNTALVVLASPQSALPAGDRALLQDYLARGGALLYLAEPEPAPVEAELLRTLGLSRLAGTVLDPEGRKRGTPSPAVVLVDQPEAHPLSAGLASLLALPWAAALEADPASPWRARALLKSPAASWLELGEPDAQARHDAALGEAAGPFALAYALERQHAGKPQRALVLGDGNLLSDGAIGNYGNAAFGLAAVNWLLAEGPGTAPAVLRVDPSLATTPALEALRAWVFPLGLPGLWLAAAVLIPLWRRR